MCGRFLQESQILSNMKYIMNHINMIMVLDLLDLAKKNKGRKENHIVKQNMQEKGINKKLSTHSDKTQTQCQII